MVVHFFYTFISDNTHNSLRKLIINYSSQRRPNLLLCVAQKILDLMLNMQLAAPIRSPILHLQVICRIVHVV